jgi:hypothetical protein
MLELKVGARDGQNHAALLPPVDDSVGGDELFEFLVDPPSVRTVLMEAAKRHASDKYYTVALTLSGPVGDAKIVVRRAPPATFSACAATSWC